jgi:hypothetical protein
MNGKEIHDLSKKITKEEVDNLINSWKISNDKDSLDLLNVLVKLGDSLELACARVIAEKIDEKEKSEIYYNAYCL